MASILPPVPWDRPQTSFEWVDWYTKLRDVIDNSALDHLSLLNLQGGNATERYHLTSAQHTALLSLLSTGSTGTDSSVPYYIASSETYTLSEYKQAFFREPIIVDGLLIVNGLLMEI